MNVAPPPNTTPPRLRIAAVGDIHCGKTSAGLIQPHFAKVHEHADVLLLCGDLTDYGTVEEAHILTRELGLVRVPMIAVLGNHDHEAGHPELVAQALREAGIQVLQGESTDLLGVGFAGVKGFLGGFGRSTLGSWGELGVKAFVKEATDEAMHLESALARLRTPQRIAIMHYSPIRATVQGEPAEIYPFLGCSRLEEPLIRYPVATVFHGHAHKGSPEGVTANGIPVYNVAMPLLLRTFGTAYRVVEIATAVDVAAE